MRYTVKTTRQFRQDYRRAKQQGQDLRLLKTAVAALAAGEPLPAAAGDRPLTGRQAGQRECRVGLGSLLVYRIDGDLPVLTLIRVGTITELYHREGVNAMKKSTSLRMLLRSPVKTAVTLLLIAAASFLFLYNLLDYAMTRREYTRTYAAYHGTFSVMRPEDRNVGAPAEDQFATRGYFFASDPKADPAYTGVVPYEEYHMRSLTAADLEAIETLPYVTRAEKRYMTGGIADFQRSWSYTGLTIVRFFHQTKRIVFTAAVDKVTPYIRGYSYMAAGTDMGLRLRDVEVLAGDEDDLMQNRAYIDKKILWVSVPVVSPE